MTTVPAFQPEGFTAARDYLQDIAKVIGKFQQVFLPAHPLDWQRGLVVTQHGIQSQELKLGNKTAQLVLDSSAVRLKDRPWHLATLTPQQLFDLLAARLQEHGHGTMDTPEFSQDGLYDEAQSKAILLMLHSAAVNLEKYRQSLPADATSPVLLYPHHFDVSFTWFINGTKNATPNDDQRTLGFSTGDQYVSEPYFYIISYPGKLDGSKPLPEGAYWQKEGFSGVILPYSALQKAADPQSLTQGFFKAAL